jgi:hypothetical protein
MFAAARDVVDDDADIVVPLGHCRMTLDKGDDSGFEACFLDKDGVMPVRITGMDPEATNIRGCGHASSMVHKPARPEKGFSRRKPTGATRRPGC